MEPGVGLVGFVIFVFLIIVMKVPISFSMALIGTGGLIYLKGFGAIIDFLPVAVYSITTHITLACLPLFLLMGYIADIGGLTTESYDAVVPWVGKLPGGLAITTVYACAIFGACSGSSVAEVAVFSKIAVPQMTSRGYNKKLALGVVASAGGLDPLIPPTIGMVLYSALTEVSLGQLLVAGIVPGIIYAAIFAVAIGLFCHYKPSYAPRIDNVDTSWKARMTSIRKVWGVAVLFFLVIGSIYFGWATADEAAGVGVIGAVVLIAVKGKFDLKKVMAATVDSAKANAMIFLIVISASIFITFMSITGAISPMVDWILGMNLPFWQFIMAMIVMWLIMGCFVDALSIMLLTLPFSVPIVEAYGYSLVWFACVQGISLITGTLTPPFGLNAYIMKAALGDYATLEEIFTGIAPFLVLMFIIIAIIALFPQLSLWLPSMMFGV